jgi:hypothetical protein
MTGRVLYFVFWAAELRKPMRGIRPWRATLHVAISQAYGTDDELGQTRSSGRAMGTFALPDSDRTTDIPEQPLRAINRM